MSERKVAICGTAPASLDKAPWQHPEWEIWATSRLYQQIPGNAWDCWFELHELEKIGRGWTCTEKEREQRREEHLDWLREQQRPIYVQEEYETEIPAGVAFPKDQVLESVPYPYFTNSISWMIGLAIYQQVDVIGVYGVDMAQNSEFFYQRPSVEWLLGIAQGQGIETDIPDECDLLKCTNLYGFGDTRAFDAKARARKQEIDQRLQGIEGQMEQVKAQGNQIAGAMNAMDQIRKNGAPDKLKREITLELERLEDEKEQLEGQMQQLQARKRTHKGAQDNMEYLQRAWMG